MTLKEFLTDKTTGKPRRGALARASEYLGVHKATVKKWMNKEWTPSLASSRRIQDMIHARIDLSAKKPPGRPKKKKT